MNALQKVRSSIRSVLGGLWSDGKGWILVAVSAGWALSIGVRFVYPALVPFLQSEFGLDLSTTGLLLSLLWGAYAIGHIPGGILGDSLGEGNILALSTAVSAGALLLVATAADAWMLFAGTIAFGLATALYGPTRFTLLTNVFPTRSGSAIGVTMAAGSAGNAAFPVVGAIAASYFTWRVGFGMFVPVFAVVFLSLWLILPGRSSAPTSVVDEVSLDTLRQIREGITRESIPIFVVIQVSVSFMIQGFSSFFPTYLIDMKDLSPGVAATLFGLFFALGAVIQPVAGSVMERIGAQKSLSMFLGGCVLALWLLPLFQGLAPLVAITILFSSLNGCFVVSQTYIADTLPEEMQGTGFGTLKAGWMTVGATSPLLMGVLADSGFFNESFFLLAGVGTVGVLLSVVYLE